MAEKTTDETYRKLRDFLDRQAAGFPATDTGSDLDMLKWMFTPEQAEVEVHMKMAPESAEVIAKRCGKPEQETTRILESMVRDGLIIPVPGKGRNYYMVLQYITGFGENVWAYRLNPERAASIERYSDEVDFATWLVEQKQMRVVPVNEAVEISRAEVATYNDVKRMVLSHQDISVSPCPCRQLRKSLGKGCDHMIDTELSFDFIARYRIDNGFGRRLTHEEALEFINAAEEEALIVSPVNAREQIAMCFCCGCSCYWMKGLKLQDRPVDYVSSSYYAAVDASRCTKCGTCVKRCQIGARTEGENAMNVELARCLGCGLCVSRCPAGASTLVLKEAAERPPATILGRYAGIAKERGVPFGKNQRLLSLFKANTFMKLMSILHRMRLAQPALNLMDRMGRF
jgi:electron transport complex protein RnfB